MKPDKKQFLDEICRHVDPSDAELEEMRACYGQHKLSNQPETTQEIRIQDGKEK